MGQKAQPGGGDEISGEPGAEKVGKGRLANVDDLSKADGLAKVDDSANVHGLAKVDGLAKEDDSAKVDGWAVLAGDSLLLAAAALCNAGRVREARPSPVVSLLLVLLL